MLPETPSIEQLSRVIGSVAAPAFLLGAVAALISVLISRMNRVIDLSLAFIERTAPKNRIQASDFRVSTADWPRASLAD